MKPRKLPAPEEIFGKGKMFEPPFTTEEPRTEFLGFNPFQDMIITIKDRTGKLTAEIRAYDRNDVAVAEAIAQILNEKFSGNS